MFHVSHSFLFLLFVVVFPLSAFFFDKMAPIFVNDYNTIKSSPSTKDRDDDISFGNMKTNGYSIVHSVMVAVIIAIVAVVGVVTFHQSSPSMSNGSDSLMSTTTAVASKDDSGYSNNGNDEFDLFLATLSEEEEQLTVIDTSLAAEDDLASIVNQCGNNHNLDFVSRTLLPVKVQVRTQGCAFQNQKTLHITGWFTVYIQNQHIPSTTFSTMSLSPVQTIKFSNSKGPLKDGTFQVLVQAIGGTVTFQMNFTNQYGVLTTQIHKFSGLPFN